MIPIYEPDVTKYTLSAKSAIDSGWISNYGEFVQLATQKLKSLLNVKHVILMNNGTSATHCLFIALKFKYPNINTIYVSNNCYVAAWNSLVNEYKHENMNVMRMNDETWNIDTSEEYIKSLKPNSAVFIVHNLGNVINVPRLQRIRPDLVFLEDNCEGFSGKYENLYSGTASLCSSVSFYGNKIITTGEGGAFITNDDEIYNYISKVYTQGMSSTRYLHEVHAYNYRMTNIQAAFLYDQLVDWDNIIHNKKRVFDNYTKLFQNLISRNKLSLFKQEENTENANWIYAIRFKNLNKSSNELQTYFKECGIDVRPFFYPIHKHKHFSNTDMISDLLDPIPERLNDSILMIPSSPNITKESQQYIVECSEKLYSE
jgi:perosamine synthetase